MRPAKIALFLQMLFKAFSGFGILGCILFLAAGTFQYPQGWLFLISLLAPMSGLELYLLLKEPEVLKRRLVSKEPEKKQRLYIALMGLFLLFSFLIAGLDYRLGLSKMPFALSVSGAIMMMLGYGLFCAVLLQNAYASRVVSLQENQQVISTGLYARVRHPMYTATLFLFFAMPIALGSYYALLPLLPFPFLLARRARNEEAVLTEGLCGYAQYLEKVRWRFIPYVW